MRWATTSLLIAALGSTSAAAAPTEYLITPTPTPDTVAATLEVAETGDTMTATLVVGQKRIERVRMRFAPGGLPAEVTLREMPGVTFRRDATGFAFEGQHARLRNRTRIVAPPDTLFWEQGSVLMAAIVLNHLPANPWSGVRGLPILSPETMTLGWLSAVHRGTQTLQVAGEAVTVDRILLFTPAGGALVYRGPKGAVLRLEAPLKGLWIRRKDTAQITIPPRAPATSYPEVDVSIPAGEVTLAGTLATPAKRTVRLPAVIMISGSGPQDRNEDGPGLPLRIFSDLADAIVPLGYAVLRTDDRGFGKSTGDFRTVARDELLADVEHTLDWLRKRPEVDPKRIWLLGHSEGTMQAARVAARRKGQVAGVISLGTMGLAFEDVYMAQNLLLGSGGVGEGLQAVGMLYAMRRAFRSKRPMAETLAEELKEWPELHRIVARERYWRGALVYDGEKVWSRVRQPILFVTGGLDCQVPPAHSEASAKAARGAGNKDVRVTILPGLDHTFRRAWYGYMGEYADRFQKTDPALIQAVAEYLRARR